MISRRRLIFLASTTILPFKAVAQIANPITINIRISNDLFNLIGPQQRKFLTSVEEDRSEEAVELASKIPPGRAAPALLIIVGAIAVTQLAQLIMEMVRQYYFGGVIIDLRYKPPKVYNNIRIPGDTLVVISNKGENVFRKRDISASIIEKVLLKGE